PPPLSPIGTPRKRRGRGARGSTIRRFQEPHFGRKAGMKSGVQIAKLIKRGRGLGLSAWAPLALLIPAGSCVPASFASTPNGTLTRAEIEAFTAPVPLAMTNNAAPGTPFLVGDQAALANAAIPVSSGPLP